MSRRSRGRHGIGGALCASALLGAAACSESAGPAPGPVPVFVYVADAGGFAELVRFRNDSAVALTGTGSNNIEPKSAASRLVFTSDRDGYPQLYISDLDVATPHRVMNSGAFDRSGSLSPLADSIVFVSTRSGAPRLWVIAAPALDQVGDDTPAALTTGSASFTPEDGPAWSPAGASIAFTSTRSGTSQVYVVASGGGSAAAVTNESGGAFLPAWSADGNSIYYLAARPQLVLRRVSAGGGRATDAVTDSLDVEGPASCDASFCLYSTGDAGAQGTMSALQIPGTLTRILFARTAARERQPAVLTP